MRRRRHNSGEDGAADECVASLTGTLADRRQAGWSSRQWVNGATAERHRYDRTSQSS
jgi:hypothetical protein